MTVNLPLLTDLGATPHYTFECELEGVTYSFELLWNDRDGCWYVQIGDSQQNPLTGFVRVLLGKLIFGSYTGTPGMPPGQFVCNDTSGTNIDPGLADLGSRVQVWYYDSADVLSNTGS